MENQQLLTLGEAARKLGVKPVTLRKWDREGKLKAVRIGSRNDRRYKNEDLENFLKPKNKLEWQEYIRSGFTWHILAPIFLCMTTGLKKYFGLGANYMMGYFEHDTLYFYYESRDLYKAGRNIVDKLVGSSQFEKNFFTLWKKKAEGILAYINKNNISRLSNLNDDELARVYKKHTEKMLDWYNLSIAIDATDESLMVDITGRIKANLKKKLGNKYTESEFTKAYSILTMPSHLSYLNREKELVLKLAQDIHEGKLKIGEDDFNRKVKDIVKGFWWTGLGWGRGKAKTIDDIIKNVKEFEKVKPNYDLELTKSKNYVKDTAAARDEINKKYHFDEDRELVKWLNLSDKLVYYHDHRKEIQMKTNYWEYQVLDEISKRTKIDVKLLDWLEIDEVVDLLQTGKFDEHEISQRSSRFLFLDYAGKMSKYSGKAAEKKHASVLGLELEETRDLQGISASPGKVVGKAHVALSLESAMKIKKGEVLVTGMTMPEYLPAMKKAAAVVTDEGGITCHAAIVSRELGIPCIVGTKYATRLIKTGDTVEVAANHGVVRILK